MLSLAWRQVRWPAAASVLRLAGLVLVTSLVEPVASRDVGQLVDSALAPPNAHLVGEIKSEYAQDRQLRSTVIRYSQEGHQHDRVLSYCTC